MSEEKQLKFGEKLKTDKKFRFEFIIGIWTGLISVMLVVAVVFVGRAYMAGSDTPTESVEEVVDDSPVLVSESAVDADDDAEETKAPYQSAIINHNEEDFMDGGEDDSEDLKTADTAYATTVVNLRKDPALTAPVIGKLQPGDKVSILKYDKEWTHVSVNGTEGYVSTIYLSTRRPAEGPTSDVTTPKPSTTKPPKTTPKPTKKPKTTKPPKTTQKPRVTKEPEQTQEPEQTRAPEPTKAPESTKEPEPTKAPESTKAPDTSENAE